MLTIGVAIEEGVIAVVDEGALNLFGGTVTLSDLHPVGNTAHVELGYGRALARVDVLGVQDHVELAIDIDDGTFAERTGDNFRHE